MMTKRKDGLDESDVFYLKQDMIDSIRAETANDISNMIKRRIKDCKHSNLDTVFMAGLLDDIEKKFGGV